MVFGSTGNFSMAWREVAGERAHQQSSGMLGVVGDARHDFRAAEALRILKRSVRDQLAGFEIDEAQDNRRGAEVHGDAVDGPGGAFHFDAVDEDAVSIASDRGIELECAIADRQSERVALDAHVSAPHGVAANVAVRGGDAGLARKAEVALEMALRLRSSARGRSSLRRPRPCTLCICLACGRRWARRCPALRRNRTAIARPSPESIVR